MKALQRLVWMLLALCFMASPLWAGGLWLYEMGTPDLGTASAGRAAMALDASTAFGNPAGMTRLERSQFLGAFQLILPSIHFHTSQATFGVSGETGNAGLITPSATGFYVHKLSPDLSLGVSAVSYFGLGMQYSDQWAGRYYLQAASLLTAALIPTAAYKVNDWLSVGAGLNLMTAKLKQSAAINNGALLLGAPDGRITMNSWAFGVGGLVGVILEPRRGTRFGVTYLTPVDLSFDDVASFDGLGVFWRQILRRAGLLGSKVDLTMTIPQQVMVSAYQQITEKFALMANFGWQDWSQFGKSNLTIADTGTTLSADANLKDTWHVAVGAQYRLAPAWLLSAGFAYDSSAVGDANRNPATAYDRQLRYAVGVQYDWRDNLTLGLAYEFMQVGNAPINLRRAPVRGTLVGDYSQYNVQFFATNLVWKF